MRDNKGDNEAYFEEFDLTEQSNEALACEWDNFLNDGFDILSINNGLITQEIKLPSVELNNPPNQNNNTPKNEITMENPLNFSFHDETAFTKHEDDDNCNNNLKSEIEKEETYFNKIDDQKDVIDYGMLKDRTTNCSFNDIKTVICSLVNSLDIYNQAKVIKHEASQSQTDKIEFEINKGNIEAFTIERIKAPLALSYHKNETFTYGIVRNHKDDLNQIVNQYSFIIASNSLNNNDSIPSKENFIQKKINKSLSTSNNNFQIPILSIKSKSFNEKHNECKDLRHESEEEKNSIRFTKNTTNHLFNTISGYNPYCPYYVIHKAYWFSVKSNVYHDYLMKQYKDNVSIAKEISVFLEKDNLAPIEASSKDKTSIQNKTDDNNYMSNEMDQKMKLSKQESEKTETCQNNVHSIQQLTHSELAYINRNNISTLKDNETEEEKTNKNDSNSNVNCIPQSDIKQSNKMSMMSLLQSNESINQFQEDMFLSSQKANRLPFESINKFQSIKPENALFNLDTSINDSQLKKDNEIKQLNKQLNNYKYQNKLVTDENKKLLEVINIFKMLSTIEKSEYGKSNIDSVNMSEAKNSSQNKTIPIPKEIYNTETKKEVATLDNADNSNKKKDSFEDIEKRPNHFSDNDCTIPLQIKLPDNYSTQSKNGKSPGNNEYVHIKNILGEFNSNTSSNKENNNISDVNSFNHFTNSNIQAKSSPKNKQVYKRKKIVEQLESILDNVKNEEPSQSKPHNKTTDPQLSFSNLNYNKKAKESSPSIKDSDMIPFHLISQRKLYENFIKSISIHKDPIKSYSNSYHQTNIKTK